MKKKDFIILIGSDGSGKSTIAQELSNILGYPVEHHGPVKSYEEGYNEYFGDIERINYSVIKDRFHEGEKIFAPIYRNYEADYFTQLEEELMKKFNVLLISCYAPLTTIKQRLEERGEDFVKPEHVEHCFNKVINVYDESKLPKMVIDTYSYSVSFNIKIILQHLFDY